MNTWKVILATLVIFGAGVVTGGLAVRYSQHAPWHKASPPAAQSPSDPSSKAGVAPRGTNRMSNPPGPLMGLRKDFVKSLECELQLTEAQREKIEKILADGQEETCQIWDPVAPQMKKVWMRVKNDIRSHLTEDQQTRFDEFMKRGRKKDERKSSPTDNLHLKDSQPLMPDSP